MKATKAAPAPAPNQRQVPGWTDDEVDRLTQIAFMCGMAAANPDFGRATLGPRTPEFMPLLDDVLHQPSVAGKRKVLALADELNRHGRKEVGALALDTKRYGQAAAVERWQARARKAGTR